MVSLSKNKYDGPAIRLADVSRWFGTTKAVDEVSFEVQAGEVFGFIGPNGAGKTTSMRILATLDIPSNGDAWVDGFSVVDDPDHVRRRLGFMPDGFGTYQNVNCEEYLDFFARAYGLRGNERRTALRNVMGFTQLDTMASKPVDGLSKGMKQRLCLGRTLIHNPSVLILDEPAAGLDPRARIELREMITELADQGKSLLISSHILTELAEMCDRVGIIEQGKLLAVGSVDEILSGNALEEIYSTDEVEKVNVVQSGVPISVVVIDQAEELKAWLEKQDSIKTVRVVGKTLVFEFSPNPEQQANLLKSMIDHQFRIVSFMAKQRSLEEAFLHVTRGRVQ